MMTEKGGAMKTALLLVECMRWLESPGNEDEAWMPK
jgi:hypothetical protein